MKRTVAIDFDGVIHKYSKGWQDGKIYDEPVEGAIEAIYELIEKDYEVVIFTTREDIKAVKDWISDKFLIQGKFIHLNKYLLEVTNIKPPAIAYIDDRGIRFTNWKDMLNYF